MSDNLDVQLPTDTFVDKIANNAKRDGYTVVLMPPQFDWLGKQTLTGGRCQMTNDTRYKVILVSFRYFRKHLSGAMITYKEEKFYLAQKRVLTLKNDTPNEDRDIRAWGIKEASAEAVAAAEVSGHTQGEQVQRDLSQGISRNWKTIVVIIGAIIAIPIIVFYVLPTLLRKRRR